MKSDADFSVERVGRDALRYHEGSRSVLVGSEMLLPKGFAVYADSIEKWDPPYEARISKEERDRIVINLCSVLLSKGEPVEVYGWDRGQSGDQ